MRRRDFAVGAGASALLPLGARAQQRARPRLIGALISLAQDNRQAQARVRVFVEELARLGWRDGANARIETRFAASRSDLIRKFAAELVALAPDVILASGGSTMAPLLQATRAIPIVFAQVPDPVGSGFVESLSRPGGNATGFGATDFGVSAKWLELLKQAAPAVARVAVIRDTTISAGIGQFAILQAAAPSLGIDLTPVGMRDAGEIERGVTAFARRPNGALVVAASGLAFIHRELIVELAARHGLPSIYFNREFVAAGGLMSYGIDAIETHRLAAGYVDRILKGEKPGDLPVQAPSKFELVVNLKTAKALRLSIPEALLVAASEVIE